MAVVNNKKKKYVLAIDETGRFSMRSDDKSFVCGIVVTKSEQDLKDAYKRNYSDFGFPEPAPDDIKSLLSDETISDGDKARYHYNKLDDWQKSFCKFNLMPVVDVIYKSVGKPALFSNNQNWWLIAVTTLIRDFLKTYNFENDSEVDVIIDNRKDNVWGMVYDDGDKLDDLSKDDRLNRFKNYHNNLKQQIESNVKKYADVRGVDLKIYFNSDTSSLFVNLADIACGFVRDAIRQNQNILTQRIIECNCKSFMDGSDPVAIAKDSPLAAMSIIFQEVINNNYNNINIVDDLMKRLRKDEESYNFLWDMFYDFIKYKIEERASMSGLVGIKSFTEMFLNEFNNSAKNILPYSSSVELMILFVEYFSHAGGIDIPFDRNIVVEYLKKNDKNSETRILRKWEKLISFTLRESQFRFNNYDFDSANAHVEEIWKKHENIIKLLKDVFFEKDEFEKDEPTAALIGTLAQSYAYKGRFDKAIKYFNLSKEYSIKTSNRSASYLFTICHRMKDIENARKYFEEQVGKTAEAYYEDKKYDDTWKLMSYCRLRALELFVEGKTALPSVEIEKLKNYNTEYPFPLVMKWESLALYLEDKDANKQRIERYFNDAIENLLRTENGFTIRTLALPLMQCYSLIDNKNQYHSKYNTIMMEMKKCSSFFTEYVDERASFLNNIKNDSDLWERAMSLPFIYS